MFMYEVRRKGDEFLLQQQITVLPLVFEDLLKGIARKGWNFFTYEEIKSCSTLPSAFQKYDLQRRMEKYKAFTIFIEGIGVCIFLDETLPFDLRTFVLAHEIGHIVLNHPCINGLACEDDDDEEVNLDPDTRNPQEVEADVFAMELHAPIGVLYRCQVRSLCDLKKLHLLPEKYARVQWADLVSDGEKYCDTIDLALCRQFESFICQHRPTRRWFHRFKTVLKVTVPICAIVAAVSIPSIWLFGPKEQKVGPTEVNDSVIVSNETKSGSTNTLASSFINDSQTSLIKAETVYVTKSGKKFHKESCRYLKNRETIALTRSDAEKNGYEACAVCSP